MDRTKTSRSLSFFSWNNLIFIFALSLLWLKLFDIVSLSISSKWHDFFSYYDGYRLPASVAAFLPFTVETLRSDDAEKIIIFTGDSTSGGLLYHHTQAIPAYFNQILNTSGTRTHTYNLPFSGAHLSEQYLLIKETVEYADVIIFPIHYSFFSGRGEAGSFISHPEISDFTTLTTSDDLTPLGIKPISQLEQTLQENLANIWYTYRIHRLLPYIVLGKPTKLWIKEKFNSSLTSQNIDQATRSIEIDSTKPFIFQDQAVQREILEQNSLLWKRIKPIEDSNINLSYLIKISSLKKRSGKQIFAYFVPINFQILANNSSFNIDTFNQIVLKSKQTLNKFDIPYIDFNDGNPARLLHEDFYNPDHLLPNGNQKVADILAQLVHHDL